MDAQGMRIARPSMHVRTESVLTLALCMTLVQGMPPAGSLTINRSARVRMVSLEMLTLTVDQVRAAILLG